MNTSLKLYDNEDLTCPICLDFPVNPPVTTPCGHVFCRDCLDDALTYKQCCPLDRRAVTRDQVKEVDKDGFIWKTWSDIEVRCGGHERGCPWIGLAKDYARHEKGCLNGMIAKKYVSCIRLQRGVESRRKEVHERRAVMENYRAHADDMLRVLIFYRQMCEMDDALGENFRRVNEQIEILMNSYCVVEAAFEILEEEDGKLLATKATVDDELIKMIELYGAMRTFDKIKYGKVRNRSRHPI